MAFDAGMMTAVVAELQAALQNAKLEKIGQPERDEILLTVRAGGEVRRVLLSASSGCPRLCFTALNKENPGVPPLFCTLLRKHLLGARIEEITQPGFERVAALQFAGRDEMGFPVVRRLYCEILGKFSNLIFTDEENKILGVLHPVDFSQSEKRQLLPGMHYMLPPAQDKADPREEERSDFMRRMGSMEPAKAAEKALVALYRGIAPTTAREIVYRAAGKTGATLEECKSESLWRSFRAVMEMVREKRFSPCVVLRQGTPVEYGFFQLAQYGREGEVIGGSASEVLERYFKERAAGETIRQKAQDILRVLTAAEGRLQRKIAVQEEELESCAEKEKMKQAADLITANLYRLKKGDRSVTVTDYYTPDMPEITLTLDPRLSPPDQAQRYYKKYTKLKTAEIVLAEQIARAKEELSYLYTVFDALTKAESAADLDEIRTELSAGHYLSAKKWQLPKKQKPRAPMTFRTSGGYTVLCGRNNLQNDALSFHIAEKEDWWFHAKNAPGSHTVLCCAGKEEPSATDFTEAAVIAATYSDLKGQGSATDGSLVTVDYTKVRELKKPPAAHPGFVVYHKNYSANVRPDPTLCEKLRTDGDKVL